MSQVSTASADRQAEDAAELRVLVIDDHRVFTELLSMALDSAEGIRWVASASTLREGLAKASAYCVDVVVIDVRLPDGSGLDAVAELRRLQPQCRVVVLTGHPRADLAERAIRAGASAFLAKEAPLVELLHALRHARPERPALAPNLPAAPSTVGLTPREREVLTLMALGLDAAGMSRRLGLSRHTVRDHVKGVLAKLGVHSQLAAVSRATALGLVDPWPG